MSNRTLMAEIYGATELFSDNLQANQHDKIRYLVEDPPPFRRAHGVGEKAGQRLRHLGATTQRKPARTPATPCKGDWKRRSAFSRRRSTTKTWCSPQKTVLSGMSFPQVADQMVNVLSVPPTTPLDCGSTLFWTQATLGRIQTYPPQISVENFPHNSGSGDGAKRNSARGCPLLFCPTDPTPQDAPQKADSESFHGH